MKLFELFKKKRVSTYGNDPNFASSLKNESRDLHSLKREMKALESNISGVKFIKEQEFEKAKECFDFAIKNGIQKAATYKYRGLCFQKNKSNYKAIDDFNQAIKIDPTDWETYYFRLSSFESLKKYEEKLIDLNNLIKLLQQQTELDPEETTILSSCQIDLKRTTEQSEINKQWNNLQTDWENKLKEVEENVRTRKTKKDLNDDD